MRKIYLLVMLMLICSVTLFSCGQSAINNSIPKEKLCAVDADCVAAACCHSSESVNSNYAPNCKGILCTADCQEGTLDCGQASSRCVEGACTVVPVE